MAAHTLRLVNARDGLRAGMVLADGRVVRSTEYRPRGGGTVYVTDTMGFVTRHRSASWLKIREAS